MKIMVTGAGALLGQGIIRSVRASSLGAEVFAVDPDARAAGLYWADRCALVPLATSAQYGPAIRRLLEQERPAALLVGTDVELAFYASQRHGIERDFGTRVVVSSRRVVEIADDKWRTFVFLRDSGFGCPLSTLDPEDENFLATARFPLVVKPRRGARSVGVRFVERRGELRAALAGLHDPIIQEWAGPTDQEYTAGALVFGGSCRASIVMRRDLRDGNTYRAYVDAYPEFNVAVRRIAERLGGYGPVNLQFRVDGGRVNVFEINARFSGTTPLRMHAGFNEVELCVREAVLGERIRQPDIRPLVALRHWEETVVAWDDLQKVAMERAADPRVAAGEVAC